MWDRSARSGTKWNQVGPKGKGRAWRPASALSRLLLPALGGPNSATCTPARTISEADSSADRAADRAADREADREAAAGFSGSGFRVLGPGFMTEGCGFRIPGVAPKGKRENG